MTLHSLHRVGPVLLSAVVLLAASLGFANEPVQLGTIEGTVLADTARPAAEAKVIAFNLDTGEAREVKTNPKGAFTFSQMARGDYELSIYHEGFEVYSSPELKVEAGKTARHDVKLTPWPEQDRQ